jgi:hypothetical protein
MSSNLAPLPEQSPSSYSSTHIPTRFSTRLAALALALVYGVIFFSRAGQLGLYVDDWGQVAEVAFLPFTQYVHVWPFDYRPFEGLPWLVLYNVFGANVAAYYRLLFGVEYAISVVLFLVAVRLFGDWWLALACALLWALYPSDPSIFWLTTFAYRFGALFLLLTVWMLAGSFRRPRLAYSAALLCTVLCLLSNELYLGLVLLLPVLAAWMVRQSPVHALARALPFLGAIASYLAYRRFIGPKLLHLEDNKTGNLLFAPGDIVNIVGHGVAMQLLGGWIAAVSSALRISASAVILPTAAVFLVLLLLCFGGLLLHRAKRVTGAAQRGSLRSGSRAMLLGLVVMVVGYVPLAFTNAVPTVDEINGRVNAAAALGASILFAGALWIVVYASPVAARARRPVCLSLLAALIAIAALR